MTSVFIEHPKIAGILGLVLALLFSGLAILSFEDVRKLPDAPSPVSISDAAMLAPVGLDGRPWLEITNGVFDCESLRYRRVSDSDRTEIIVTDQVRSLAIIAEYSSRLTCQEVSQKNPAGLLSRMNEERYRRFLKFNEFDLSDYRNAEIFMDLCAWCGRGNSLGLVVLGTILALLSLSLYPLCLLAHRMRYGK